MKRRHRDGGHDEQQHDREHAEREQLLAHPAPARPVVDPAERGVERAPERGGEPHGGSQRRDPGRGRGRLEPPDRAAQRALGGGREQLLEVEQHGALKILGAQHAAGHEQRDERDREDREQQVVGDHRRETREVVLIGLAPEVGHRGAGSTHPGRIIRAASAATPAALPQALRRPAARGSRRPGRRAPRRHARSRGRSTRPR